MKTLQPVRSPVPSANPINGVHAEDERLREACQQFEAVFLLQLWRAMQRTVPQQRQTLNYAEMFDLTFAEYLARYGQFGIAEKLYEQLIGADPCVCPQLTAGLPAEPNRDEMP
ncbi:hypothetical protein HRbin15_02296 [bacterium HR15]|nr:hypothetical protein HRbin15_02296 [bacterium HR15]